MNFLAITFFSIFACSYCQYGDIKRYHIENYTLEMSNSSSTAWPMSQFFGSLNYLNILFYSIEGNSPCTIEIPSMTLQNVFNSSIDFDIVDFALVDNDIYLLTESSIVKINIDEIYKEKRTNTKKIINTDNYNFKYIDAFKLNNGVTFFFLKPDGNRFYYAYADNNDYNKLKFNEIGTSILEFDYKMKIFIEGKYIFIPDKTKGVYAFHCNGNNDIVLLNHINSFKDVRDIAIKVVSKTSDAYMMIADYEQGLIIGRYNFSTGAFSELKVFREFIKITSVVLTKVNELDHLLLIISEANGFTQLIDLILIINLSVDILYNNMEYLDGIIQYGDAKGEYLALLMENSILVNSLTKTNLNYQYVSSEKVTHAKFYNTSDNKIFLIYTNKNKIYGDKAINTDGYLICNKGKMESYNFSVMGFSRTCNDFISTVKKPCYYQTNITLNVIEQSITKSLYNLKRFAIAFGILFAVVIIDLILCLICIYRRYRIAKLKLLEYNPLVKVNDPLKMNIGNPNNNDGGITNKELAGNLNIN